MFEGNKKVQKTVKTKFRKERDFENSNGDKKKQKHHDKSYYRLMRQEREEYEV